MSEEAFYDEKGNPAPTICVTIVCLIECGE